MRNCYVYLFLWQKKNATLHKHYRSKLRDIISFYGFIKSGIFFLYSYIDKFIISSKEDCILFDF